MDVRGLAQAAAAAPLVLRVREFLWWVGDRRRVSRERVASAPHGYVYLSLGAWIGDEDAADDRPDCEFQDGVELLSFMLAARMLEVVVERRDRSFGGGSREHGWVLPGPECVALPEESARVWRRGVELLPVLWRQRDPRVDQRLTETVPRRLLERLEVAGDLGVSVRALCGECERSGVSGAGFEIAMRLLESLGLVHFDYTLDSGERCVLTPLGRHAITLMPPAKARTSPPRAL